MGGCLLVSDKKSFDERPRKMGGQDFARSRMFEFRRINFLYILKSCRYNLLYIIKILSLVHCISEIPF